VKANHDDNAHAMAAGVGVGVGVVVAGAGSSSERRNGGKHGGLILHLVVLFHTASTSTHEQEQERAGSGERTAGRNIIPV